MNINFEMAVKMIDFGSYDEAQSYLRKAIDEEMANGNEQTAIEYTCVLGDLLSNLDEEFKAKTEFEKVVEYCNRTGSLPKQMSIASDFLAVYDLKSTPNSKQESSYKQ